MFKKRNRPNPIVQTHSCTILWCALHACNCLATGCLFSSCYWRPVRGISQTQNRKGQGRSKIKQWREIAMLYSTGKLSNWIFILYEKTTSCFTLLTHWIRQAESVCLGKKRVSFRLAQFIRYP